MRGLMRGLRACHQWPMFYAVLLLLGSIQLVWAVIAFVIRHAVSEERGRRIGRRVISTVFRHCFRLTRLLGLLEVDAGALDAIDPDEAMIIAPNHPSVMDALILISRIDNLNCIMKASVLDNILLGSGARLAGYIRNDGPRRMLRLSTEHLKQGGQLIIFPEGTRTITAPVNEFKCGFAAMARVARVPVQTVIIETDSPYMSKGWPALKIPKHLPITVRVRLGKRFDVAADQDVNLFVDGLREYFSGELAGAQLGALWNADRQTSHDDKPAEVKPPPRAEVPTAIPPLTSSRWG
jgi:1-acyl-sn-glycerol-3-phosphate acyltransferase